MTSLGVLSMVNDVKCGHDNLDEDLVIVFVLI